MRPTERLGFLLLGFLVVAFLASCQSPPPVPSATPTGPWVDMQTRVSGLETREPHATGTSTRTPTRTTPTRTALTTYTATPSGTPTASAIPTATATPAPTQTPTPGSLPSLTVTVNGTAKAGSYLEFDFAYNGPAAEFGLLLADKTAFYSDQRPLVPPSGCGGAPTIRWCVQGNLSSKAYVYFLSTAQVGEVIILTAYTQTAEERQTMQVPVVVGGGTAPTPTRTPTPRATATSGAVLTLYGNQWTRIDNPTRAEYAYVWTPGVDLGANGCTGGTWDNKMHFFNRLPVSCTAGERVYLWAPDPTPYTWLGSLEQGLSYGWHEWQLGGLPVLYATVTGWPASDGVSIVFTRVKFSSWFCESASCMEGLG